MAVDDLPLRPMTAAEVLDAAVGVFRRRPWRLLGLALALAVLEQAALYPLRVAALARRSVDKPLGFYTIGDYIHALNAHTGSLWLLLSVGMATEAAVIALVGGVASRSAVGLLLAGVRTRPQGSGRVPEPAHDDAHADGSGLPRSAEQWGRLVVASAVIGAGAFLTFAFAAVPWVFWFMFTGLAAPSLIIDGGMRAVASASRTGNLGGGSGKPPPVIGAFRAIGRSFQLVGRANLRPGGLRLLGFLTWFLLRMLVGAVGVSAFVGLIELSSHTWVAVIGYSIWLAINTVTYASTASLDATIHTETRMRLEGLDISLRRAAATRTPVATVLAAPSATGRAAKQNAQLPPPAVRR